MKKNNIPDSIKEKVIELNKKGISYRDIVDNIRGKFSQALDENFNFHDVKFIIDKLKTKTNEVDKNLKELSNIIEDDNSGYEVTDDHYIFFQKRPSQETGEIEINKFPIKIETVDMIFKAYSKHGLNWSGERILQEFGIKVELWNIIKNRLRLFKDSHIISPATLDRLSPEELEEVIEKGIHEHIDDKYRAKFVKSYEKQKDEDYVIKSKKIANLDYKLEKIKEFLEGYKPRDIKIECEKIENDNEMTAIFGDLHIGKMDTKKVLARLSRMTVDIVNRPERKVNLVCLGDLFETLAKGGMHPGQIESMEGLYGFPLFEEVISIFETILLTLYKAGKEVTFYGLGGNHDRFNTNKEDGFAGIAALMVYLVIKKSLQNINVEINLLRETWNVVDIQGFRYILHHGDDRANLKKPSEVLWELGDRTKPNIIAMADKHHLEQKDTNTSAVHLLIPGMAGANEYDRKLLLSSYPGYVMVLKDYFDGTPQTLVRRFND